MRAVLAINQKRNRDSKLPREKAQRGADRKLRGRVVGSRVASWQRMPDLCRSDGEHDGRRPPHC